MGVGIGTVVGTDSAWPVLEAMKVAVEGCTCDIAFLMIDEAVGFETASSTSRQPSN